MTLYLSKLLALVLMPLGLAVLLGIIALAMVAVGRRRAATLLLAVQLSLLWVSSTPWAAMRLMLWLEGDFPPVALADTPPADVAIVLGGAVGRVGEPAVENLTGASDRVLRAARLQRAGKVDAVLAVGGNLSWSGYRVPESALIRDLLVEWGVPEDAILLETRSQNTRQNALFAAEVIAAQGWDRVLLVTSASHMKRAVGAFRAVGVEVIPSPTDYAVLRRGAPVTPSASSSDTGGTQTVPSGHTADPTGRRSTDSDAPTLGMESFLPSAKSLTRTTVVIREVLGRTYYRLRGWM